MSKINIEEIVKSKLKNYELPYDNSWDEFEKKLKKSKVSYTKYYFAAAAAVVLGVLYFSFMNSENTINETNNELIAHDTYNKQETKIISKVLAVKSVDAKKLEKQESNNTIVVPIKKENKQHVNEVVDDNKDLTAQDTEKTTSTPKTQNITPALDENLNSISANFKANTLSGCEPFTVYFTPENTEDAEYEWVFNDGTVSTEKMPKHTFEKAGNYSVELVVKSLKNNKIVKSIKNQYISVNPKPKSEFTMSNTDNIYYFDCNDNYKSVKWLVNSKSFSSDIDPEYEFKTIGKSEVLLVVENEFKCTSTYSKVIDIEPVFQIANAFTPDNNGDNEMFGPVFENFDNYTYYLYIYDAYGKLIFKSNYKNQNWNGKLSNSNSIAEDGTYIWKLVIKDDFGNKETKKGQVALRK